MRKLAEFCSTLGATICVDIALGLAVLAFLALSAWDLFITLATIVVVFAAATTAVTLAWVIGYTIADRFRR